jgi:5-methylthioadenosine/S-adenosylhomocysteine deaminase
MASNNHMDLWAESRAAMLAQRARGGRHDALSPDAALRLATLSGARALGLDADIGSLEVGKAADLAAFPIVAEHGPVHDPEAAAVLALPGTAACLVTVAGRELVSESKLLAWDAGLPARVERTAARMRQQVFPD